MYIQIENDVFDIANRIKYIDRNYVVYFNTLKTQFEVHNLAQTDGTFCLSVPKDFLDESVLTLVQKTSSSNIDIILDQINNENQLKENAETRSILNKFNDQLEQSIKGEE